jgi:glycosyltransferase involved in cell wall biosynthesis
MRPMVSIIVPVYNAQDFLERCVDSILQQEYTNFELLLLDDGSTDRSPEICDRYAEADKRVRVIHKENSGVSATRNLALDSAKGKYLQFVDSDDWIAADATRLFVQTAEEYACDMVICDFYRVVGERVSHKGDIKAKGVLSIEEFAGYMMEDPADFYYGVLWNKFYRNDIIKKHNLRMDNSISWCEDFMFNLEYLRYAEHVCPIHNPLYYYVKRDVFSYYNNFYKHILDEEQYEKNRLQVYKFLVDSAGDGTVMPVLMPGAWKLGDEQKKDKPKYAGRDIHATLQQLRQVIAIADCGSMNEASKRLFISQPTLSAAVKELEKGLGITLFMRSNRGIIITPEGEEFLGYARAVEEQFSLTPLPSAALHSDSRAVPVFSCHRLHRHCLHRLPHLPDRHPVPDSR